MSARINSITAMFWLVLLGYMLFGSSITEGSFFGISVVDARTVHVFDRSFGGAGSGDGQFNGPRGVAVNDTTGDVYVVDSANDRVEYFSASGVYLGQFNGSGALPGEGGAAPSGQFSNPTEIVVDNSDSPLSDPSAGDIYVVDTGHGVIDEFSATGAYIAQIMGTCEKANEVPPACVGFVAFKRGTVEGIAGLAVGVDGVLRVNQNQANRSGTQGEIDTFSDAQPNQYLRYCTTVFGTTQGYPGLAVDKSDDIYFNTRAIAKLNGNCETLISPFGGEATAYGGVAVDPGHEEVYIDYGTSIGAYSLDDKPLEEPFGGGYLGKTFGFSGVAVDAANGEVFASNVQSSNVAAFRSVALPDVRLAALSEQTPRSVALNGWVNPEGEPVTSCVFEYDTREYRTEKEKGHGLRVPCSPSNLGTGHGWVAVSAHLSGLTPETHYYYRLSAENSASIPSSTEGSSFFTGPILGGQFASGITSSSVTLGVSLDPNGDDTHYYFEYGRSTAYGSFVPVSPPGADIGALPGAQSLLVHIQGLQPGTGYHYKLIAEQNGELFEEPDGAFVTQRVPEGSVLPDGRAWELVSPADKKGALIGFFPEYTVDLQAASDGRAVEYRVFGQLGEGALGHQNLSYVFSSRWSGHWSSQDLTLPDRPASEGEDPVSITGSPEYVLFSPDLSEAAVAPHRYTPPLIEGINERTLYVRENTSGGFTPLVTSGNTPPGTEIGAVESGNEQMTFIAATHNLKHFVLWSPVALAEGENGEYYEWSEGELRPIGVLPDGTHVKPHTIAIAGETARVGAVQRAISEDGRWIAWTIGNPYSGKERTSAPLYVRDMVSEKTVRVGGEYAVYQTMNQDGSKVFYLEDGDLYVFETSTGTTTDLTWNHGVNEPSADVREVVSDVSEDGAYVYFVASGILAEGAVSGQPNLYLLHYGEGTWTATYVATLSDEDEKSWYAQYFKAPDLGKVSSRISPDGRYLVFMSNKPLTGYDNRDIVSNERDEEVFLYDAAGGRLACISCDPTGARPVGVLDRNGQEPLVDREGSWTRVLEEGESHWLAGSVPGWDQGPFARSMYQPRYLLGNGRVFFDSPDALVPEATNGLEDVYEYEPSGVGSCVRRSVGFNEASNGCVSLISSGISSAESAFYDASETGNDVFFITTAKLVLKDQDTAYDVYNAHVCSGELPCPAELTRTPACTNNDSCKPAPGPQPELFGAPPSQTFSGPGNALPQRGVLTRAQRLARDLRACRKKRTRHKRLVCERKARRRYAPIKSKRTVRSKHR